MNKAFCELVWSAVRDKFTGRLSLENITDLESDDKQLILRANELIRGPLSHMAARVRAIDASFYWLYALSNLDLELLTGLKIVRFTPPKTCRNL